MILAVVAVVAVVVAAAGRNAILVVHVVDHGDSVEKSGPDNEARNVRKNHCCAGPNSDDAGSLDHDLTEMGQSSYMNPMDIGEYR